MAKEIEAECKIEVITVCDHHDKQFLLDKITEIAETGTAHVRYLGEMAEGLENTFAVSKSPISHRQVMKGVHDREIEFARDHLKLCHDPYDVWQSFALSVAEICRLAKEEGIVLTRDWIRTGEEEEKKRAAGATRAEVGRLEGLLNRVSGDLQAARTHAQASEFIQTI